MSDNSLEGVTTTSEPAEDVKKADVRVETEEETKVDDNKDQSNTEEKTEEDTPAKEPTKLEKLEAAKQKAIESMQKRIDRKTAAHKADLERMHRLERELADISAKLPKADDAPKEEDFNTWEDYNKAVIQHEANKLAQEKLEAEKQAELERAKMLEHERNRREFEAKELAFREKNPEYDNNAKQFAEQVEYLVSRYGADNQTLVRVNEMLVTSDVAPAVINHLGNNPDIAEEWVNMPPSKAIREVFKLEQNLSDMPETKTKDLPPPAKPLKGSGKPGGDLSKMSGEELRKRFKV